MDATEYEDIKKTVGLLILIAQGEEDIRNGNLKSQDQVFKNIGNKLGEYKIL